MSDLFPDPPPVPIEPALRLLRTVAAGSPAEGDELAAACATLLVEHDRLRRAVNLTVRCRHAQRTFFATRREPDLVTAKELEHALDRALKRIPWGVEEPGPRSAASP